MSMHVIEFNFSKFKQKETIEGESCRSLEEYTLTQSGKLLRIADVTLLAQDTYHSCNQQQDITLPGPGASAQFPCFPYNMHAGAGSCHFRPQNLS